MFFSLPIAVDKSPETPNLTSPGTMLALFSGNILNVSRTADESTNASEPPRAPIALQKTSVSESLDSWRKPSNLTESFGSEKPILEF